MMNKKCKICGSTKYHINKNGICKKCSIKYKQKCFICGKIFYNPNKKKTCEDENCKKIYEDKRKKQEKELWRVYSVQIND